MANKDNQITLQIYDTPFSKKEEVFTNIKAYFWFAVVAAFSVKVTTFFM